mgnify:CR=1 FL=1
MPTTRQPAVAGSFYPASKTELDLIVSNLLQQVDIDADSYNPRAIIAPHAGYIYSGGVAAAAYSTIANHNFKRVLLLGPSHRVPFYGMALSRASHFTTPLGTIPVDTETVNKLCSNQSFDFNDSAHMHEHSLETQLPFLQKIAKNDFTIIPILVSETDYISTASALAEIIDDKDTITVISSDLSHFHTYEDATELDNRTNEKITSLKDNPICGKEACGCHPINVILEAARQRGWKVTKLEIKNSGDTFGSRDSVVGYGAYCFEE